MSPPSKGRLLTSAFYARDTVGVARALLGCTLESRLDGEKTVGRIVEVEAYVGPHDPAAHGYANKKTKRNAALFGPPGTAYVYFIYGMHWCFNAVTERNEYPSAVLIRALQPLAGLDAMRERRGVSDSRLLCSGPARLCKALGIAGSVDGTSLSDGPVRISSADSGKLEVMRGRRVGISRAESWPLRFVVKDSDWLSRPMR